MKQTVTEQTFKQAFIDSDNRLYFSHQGLDALFKSMEQYECDTGEEIELDVTAICCEYVEYGTIEEFQEAYGTDYTCIEDIEKSTLVIEIPDSDSFIIQAF